MLESRLYNGPLSPSPWAEKQATYWRIRMGEHNGAPGEFAYEYVLQFTRVVEYGISADAFFKGQVPPPAEGARFDVYFKGPISGPKVKGTLEGVDFLHIRADGRCQLHIHAEITTEDGKKIALAADGVAIPQPGSPVFQLRENATLTTNHPEYSWLNSMQFWAPGTVDVAKGEIRIKGYIA
jgi:Protein of unknown function (DUF3237)